MRITHLDIVRAGTWVALGIALSVCGVAVFSLSGGLIWALLLAISLLDGLGALAAYREGQKDGILYGLQEAERRGILKPRDEWPPQ